MNGFFCRGSIGLVLLLVAGCDTGSALTAASESGVGSLRTVTGFGSNPGGLNMYIYTPSRLAANPPAVFALHGCTQTARDYQGTGLNELAEQYGFLVVYPEEPASNRCFRWYERGQTRRGGGEVLSLKQMADYVVQSEGADPRRIFISGLSAGGAMVSAALASYPDVFSAGAIFAGIPHGCANSLLEVTDCMFGNKNLTASQWGDLVRSTYAGAPFPRVAIWQGSADYTVNVKNEDALIAQWTNVHGIDQTADETTRVGRATRTRYKDQAGQVLVEAWLVDGMGHGVPVDSTNGCGTAAAFSLEVGLCSARSIVEFFGISASSPPPPPAADAGPADGPVLPDSAAPQSDSGGCYCPCLGDAATPPPPAFACQEFFATRYQHVIDGRAHRCGSYNVYVCANGSEETLGLWNLESVWVRETQSGYFESGRCP